MIKYNIERIDFTSLFYWCRDNAELDWNTCNDLFFNYPLDYGSVTDVCPEYWDEHLSEEVLAMKKESPLDFTKEEIDAMGEYDRANIWLHRFLHSTGSKEGEVEIDCRS